MHLLSLAFVAALTIAAASTAVADEPVTLFGKLPLGGKMKTPKACSSSVPGNVEDVCLLSAPRAYKGGRLASVRLPVASKPAWADDVEVALFLKGDELRWVEVKALDADLVQMVVTSISQRFGSPSDISMSPPNARYAEWRRPDVRIWLACGSSNCWLQFASAAHLLENQSRPASP